MRTIGNLLTNSDTTLNCLVNSGICESIYEIMQHPKRNVRKEVCWAISNITADQQDHI